MVFERRRDKELSDYFAFDVDVEGCDKIFALSSNLLMECDPATFAFDDYDNYCFDMESFDFVQVCNVAIDYVLRIVSDECGVGSKERRLAVRFDRVPQKAVRNLASPLSTVHAALGSLFGVSLEDLSKPHFLSVRGLFGAALDWLGGKSPKMAVYVKEAERRRLIFRLVECYATYPFNKRRHEIFFRDIPAALYPTYKDQHIEHNAISDPGGAYDSGDDGDDREIGPDDLEHARVAEKFTKKRRRIMDKFLTATDDE